MSRVAANLGQVRAKIAVAAERAGRPVSEITLVAVTKAHPVDVVIEAYQAGLRNFGENRAAEGYEKSEAFARWHQTYASNQQLPAWHFIGHIQSRQANMVLNGDYSLLHSVDSLKLAERLNRLAQQRDRQSINVLLQCNISGEATKSGFTLQNWQNDAGQLQNFMEIVNKINNLKKLNISGLMTMAPIVDNPEQTRPTFKSLAALHHTLKQEVPHISWRHLSMGMTDDFEVAIEEGATLVRVGRAIFGERAYP